ncbi:hypothetical protein JYG36_13520 [Pseudomonas sp. SORT22]|uniref:hypothetical protein n=1 Tax=Pseudomonas sp. SORT22 TaxID=2813842 RepID=UPI001BCAE170|nr:hypothetical protein [Pseudomonas sp. SORT22]QVM94146.1 hypothetical protein JYG36_13520 [Pseudomonas sp. SORT22]
MDKAISFIPVIGPVVAALIAALITFVVTVLAKENKTSEFRQAWIESMRNDVSELLGEYNILEGVFDVTIDFSLEEAEVQNQVNEFWKSHQKEYAKIDLLCNRIVLRLNPKEHAALIEKLSKLESSIGDGHKKSAEMSRELVRDFALLFKMEWNRVKEGETVFRRMKYGAFLVFTVGGAILAGVLSILAYKAFVI